jgi:hypothetical protein
VVKAIAMNKKAALTAVGLTLALWVSAPAFAYNEDTLPIRQHDPAACAASDAGCLRAAYEEYKNMLLIELHAWRRLEGRIAHIVSTKDENEASVLQGMIIGNGLYYLHMRWPIPAFEQIELAGVPTAEWDALSDCRSAIINLKYLLIGIKDKENVAQEKRDYLYSLGLCGKQFKLDPVDQAFFYGNYVHVPSQKVVPSLSADVPERRQTDETLAPPQPQNATPLAKPPLLTNQ